MNEEEIGPSNGNNVALVQEVDGISMEEFKSKFFAWYENTGLVTEMRAHLRHQMISKLHHTNLGQTISSECAQSSVSPKAQMVHLLIAEFLHHHRHFYTLSIFVAEVPHLNVYPEFVNAIKSPSNNQFEAAESQKPTTALQTKDILDVLDVFEIRQTRDRQVILDAYTKDNHESLLTTIINHLTQIEIDEPQMENAKNLLDKSLPDLDSFRWNMGIHNLLTKAKIKGSLLYILKENIFRFYQEEVTRIRTEEKTKYNKQLSEKLDAVEQGENNEYRKQRDEFQNKYLRYRKALELELRQKKKLEGTIQNLNTEFERVSQEIAKLENQAPDFQRFEHQFRNEIKEKNDEIEHLKLELNTRTAVLNERDRFATEMHEMLEKTQLNYSKKIEEYLETITELQTRNLTTQRELDDVYQRNQELNEQLEKNLVLKEQYDRVKDENEQLRMRLNDVRLRSEQLNQDFQTRVTSFPSITMTDDDDDFRQMFYTPPSSNIPVAPVVQVENRQKGGGEESSHNDRNPPMIYRQVSHSNQERKTPRRLLITPPDSSPTEDVLEEAHRRLRRLEEESQTVQQNYEQFRQQQPRFIDLFRLASETLSKSQDLTSSNLNDVVKKMYDIRANNYQELKNKNLTELLTATNWTDQLPLYYVPKSEENNFPKAPPEDAPVVEPPETLPYPIRSNQTLPKEKLDEFLKQVESSFQHLDNTAMEISKTLTHLSVNSNQLTQEMEHLPSENVQLYVENEEPPKKSTGAIKKTYSVRKNDTDSEKIHPIKVSNRFYFEPKKSDSVSNNSLIEAESEANAPNPDQNSLNSIEEVVEWSASNSIASVRSAIKSNETLSRVYSQRSENMEPNSVLSIPSQPLAQTSEILISPQKKILAEIEKTLIEGEKFLKREYVNDEQQNGSKYSKPSSVSEKYDGYSSDDTDNDISAGIDDISNNGDNFWN